MTDNRAAFTEFCRIFYTEKNVRAAFEYLVVEDYVQHNPSVPDGREAGIVQLSPTFDGSPEAGFEILRIMVDGDHAMVHVKATRPGRPDAAVADIYRFSDGRIVEHWDVIQLVPEKSVHNHPMF